MEKKYVLAVDIGTSSVRVYLSDENGSVVVKKQTFVETITYNHYFQEQDPQLVAEIVIDSMREVVKQSNVSPDQIKGISFSSQMYNVFPIDDDGNPLYNMILWSDARSERQVNEMISQIGKDTLYTLTGCPLNSLYPISKLVWLRQNESEIFFKAFKFVSIKSYIIHKFTQSYVVDYSMASSTGLFNIHTLEWCQEALDLVGLKRELLEEPIDGLEAIKITNVDLASRIGLDSDTIIISGGGDGPLANIGVQAISSGVINVDLGTSGAARVLTNSPILDNQGRLWCYAFTNDKWVYGGIISNVGNGFAWLVRNIADFRENHSIEDVYSIVTEELLESNTKDESLYFIPDLVRARSPYWDNKTKATIYGLNHGHTLVDIFRAYQESIGYNLYSIINMISEELALEDNVVLSGGMSTSPYMCQLLANILGREIRTKKSSEGSISGAIIMALYATGLIDSLKLDKFGETETIYTPQMDLHAFYMRKAHNYNILLEAIRKVEM